MSKATQTSKKWTCEDCGVTVSRMGGERVALPESWVNTKKEGTLCLLCRRERAAKEALDASPESGLEERAKLRRAALIEFEVRRNPDHPDGVIARTCRSSAPAVAKARQRLGLADHPTANPRSANDRKAARR